MLKISRKAARGFMYCFQRAAFFVGVWAQDTHNVDSWSTPRKSIQFQSNKKCCVSRGNVGMLSSFCAVYFTMDEHRSLVLLFPPIHLSLPKLYPRVKNPSVKAFYSWTIPNLFCIWNRKSLMFYVLREMERRMA